MELKGKTLSLLSKVLALVFVIVCFVVSVVARIPIPIDDTIKVAVFVALVFSPVDVSMWIQNFFGSRPRKTIPDDGKDHDAGGV
ncbi:MAG: hypothetical protein K2H09_08755 [Treponemataceae bacterium]|nr:hypothetical protein [Treponemataceae bacterium]